MPSNVFELISKKLELFRLEQRYTKRRNRRSTFVSEATYVDGEYVYNIPSPTGSSTTSSTTSTSPSKAFGGLRRSSTKSGERGPPRANGTDGKRTDAVVVGVQEISLAPVDDLRDAQIVGRERERRWSGVQGSWGRRTRGDDKRVSMLAVREVRWEEDSDDEVARMGRI